MNINKKIGMNEILSELNLNDTGEDGIYHFDIKDKFFVGGGCEKPWVTPQNKVINPSSFKNIAICAELMTDTRKSENS
jgi:hypothetical protein